MTSGRALGCLKQEVGWLEESEWRRGHGRGRRGNGRCCGASKATGRTVVFLLWDEKPLEGSEQGRGVILLWLRKNWSGCCGNNASFTALLCGLKEIMYKKHLVQCLEYCKKSIQLATTITVRILCILALQKLCGIHNKGGKQIMQLEEYEIKAMRPHSSNFLAHLWPVLFLSVLIYWSLKWATKHFLLPLHTCRMIKNYYIIHLPCFPNFIDDAFYLDY